MLDFMTHSEPLVREILFRHIPCKMNTSLLVRFERDNAYVDDDDTIDHYFSVSAQNVLGENWIDDAYGHVKTTILTKFAEFLQKGSAWLLAEIYSLNVRTTPTEQVSFNSYKPLPKFIRSKNAIVNTQNDDNFCFKYAMTVSLNPEVSHPERVSRVLRISTEKYKWGDIHFDDKVGIKQLKVFEKNNPDIGLVLRTIDPDSGLITKLWLTSKMNCEHRADLFLYDGHFSCVRNKSHQLSAQMSSGHAKYFCEYCNNAFSTHAVMTDHMRNCKDHDFITVKYPERARDGNVPKLYFKYMKKLVRHPIMITADFEALLLDTQSKHGKNTTRYQIHKASCVGMHITRFDGRNQYLEFTGPNCAVDFAKHLEKISLYFIDEFYERWQKIDENGVVKYDTLRLKYRKMSREKWRVGIHTMDRTYQCYFCEETFGPDDVRFRDHCHFTGKFRGIAHRKCNLQFQVTQMTPFFSTTRTTTRECSSER